MVLPNFQELLLNIPAIIIAFAFHEWAHAMVADYFGDPTPRSQGRLSLNPFVHLDLVGTLLALFFIFGWAKPVQTRPSLYRGNIRRADMFVSLAGPLMNLLIGLLAAVVYNVLQGFVISNFIATLVLIFDWIAYVNIMIGILNLIPIPGLDGYHVLRNLLPSEKAAYLYGLEQYGMIIFALLIVSGILGKIVSPLGQFVYALFNTIANSILSLFGVG